GRAEAALGGRCAPVTIPDKPVREKRALIEHRQKLVGRRVALQNRIRAILVAQGLAAPVGVRAWSELGLAGIAAHARPLAECSAPELWRGRLELTLHELGHVRALLDQAEQKLDELAKTDDGAKLLQTIPGVGPRTAEAVAAFLPEPQRFRTTKQVSAYGGVGARAGPNHRTRPPGPATKRRAAAAGTTRGRGP